MKAFRDLQTSSDIVELLDLFWYGFVTETSTPKSRGNKSRQRWNALMVAFVWKRVEIFPQRVPPTLISPAWLLGRISLTKAILSPLMTIRTDPIQIYKSVEEFQSTHYDSDLGLFGGDKAASVPTNRLNSLPTSPNYVAHASGKVKSTLAQKASSFTPQSTSLSTEFEQMSISRRFNRGSDVDQELFSSFVEYDPERDENAALGHFTPFDIHDCFDTSISPSDG